MMEEDEDPGGACAACCRGQLLAFCGYIGKSQVSHVKLAQDAKEPPWWCSVFFFVPFSLPSALQSQART